MSNPADFLSAQFLAEHQHFVRRLALGLARDEAGAEDLAQETWLAALTNRSQEIVNPRAWLATAMRRRAMNLARGESVRHEHEVRAARTEAAEDERLHERVHFQHSIVAAVLALDEPYRSVVMLRYFQDLSPAAIARRKKIPAATVRSQLARAHTQLRERLEAREGGREAWCLGLAGVLDASKPLWIPAQLLALVATVCATLSVAGGAWMWTQRASPALEVAGATVKPLAALAGLVEPTFESARVAVLSAGVSVPASAAKEGPSKEELEAKSLDELVLMLQRVEDELRPRLLTPPADAIAAWRVQHPDTGMEFARVLDRSKFIAEFDSGVVGVRGGGSFYSFATRSQSYDEQPTIGVDGDRFHGAFYGNMQAVLVDFGSAGPAGMPVALDAAKTRLLAVLSRGPALPEDVLDPDLKSVLAERRTSSAAIVLQHAYLLRSVSPNEHDLLAIVVPIHRDEFSVTLAWRILQTWPVPDLSTGPKNLAPRIPVTAEAWTAAMSTDGLLLLIGRIRVLTTARLMAIPDSLKKSWPDRPIARVMNDFLGTRLVNINGGGRFFNFATRSNDYQDAPDIGLDGESLSGASNTGRPTLMLDLGAASALDVSVDSAPPADETAKRVWGLAWNFERRTPAPDGKGPAVVTQEEFRLFHNELRGGSRPVATVGHTYLVRSIVPGKHDHLVAFEVLAKDEHGIFITWRILKTWPA